MRETCQYVVIRFLDFWHIMLFTSLISDTLGTLGPHITMMGIEPKAFAVAVIVIVGAAATYLRKQKGKKAIYDVTIAYDHFLVLPAGCFYFYMAT